RCLHPDMTAPPSHRTAPLGGRGGGAVFVCRARASGSVGIHDGAAVSPRRGAPRRIGNGVSGPPRRTEPWVVRSLLTVDHSLRVRSGMVILTPFPLTLQSAQSWEAAIDDTTRAQARRVQRGTPEYGIKTAWFTVQSGRFAGSLGPDR